MVDGKVRHSQRTVMGGCGSTFQAVGNRCSMVGYAGGFGKKGYIKLADISRFFRKPRAGDIEIKVSENSLHKTRPKTSFFPKQGTMSPVLSGGRPAAGDFRKIKGLLSRLCRAFFRKAGG